MLIYNYQHLFIEQLLYTILVFILTCYLILRSGKIENQVNEI
jgi:hypothetical protein